MARSSTETTYDHDAAENGFEGSAETTLRHTLNLRPAFYRDSAGKGSHPDSRPCPSWCWVGQHPECDHDVDPEDPMVAVHVPDAHPHVVASLYQGTLAPVSDQLILQTASIDPRLEQVGQDRPTIQLMLRQWVGGEEKYAECLRLTVEDAEELATALSHLVRVADDASQELLRTVERNALAIGVDVGRLDGVLSVQEGPAA